MLDELQGRIPPLVKWLLAGMGAAGGWHYAQAHDSSIPLSCIVAGIAAGFCLVACGFFGLRLLRAALMVAAVLFVINYAVLVPYGYGDHWPGWLHGGRAVFHWLETRDWPRPDFAR